MPKITFKKIVKAFLPYGVLYIWRKYNHQILKVFRNKFSRKCDDTINTPDIDIPDNCVLVIEVTEHHGEVLPGLAKYVLDLGYHADVVMAYSAGNSHSLRNATDVFSRFHNAGLRVFLWESEQALSFLHDNKVKKYKHIIINTYYDFIFKNIDMFKLKPVCMLHQDYEFINEYGKTNKIISLVRMDCFDREQSVVVNAHYFGGFIIHDKNKITEFVAFGNTGESSRRRNVNLIGKICGHLKAKKLNNYKINIVGDNNFNIPDEYRENIQTFGFLTFSEMYKRFEQADFILALIDPSSIEYTNKASGTYQLSYGFIKPVLIHKKFADIGNFTYENSIIYENLFSAVEQAISMTCDEYNAMVEHLKTTTQLIYKNSLYNLKTVLEAEVKIL